MPIVVVDLYVDKKSRVWIIDFNPFGFPTNPLLFSWEELQTVEWIPDHRTEFEFRIVSNSSELLPNSHGEARGPIDTTEMQFQMEDIMRLREESRQCAMRRAARRASGEAVADGDSSSDSDDDDD